MMFFYIFFVSLGLLFGNNYLEAMDPTKVYYHQLSRKLDESIDKKNLTSKEEAELIRVCANLNLTVSLIAAFGLPPRFTDQVFNFATVTVYDDGSSLPLNTEKNIDIWISGCVAKAEEDVKEDTKKLPTKETFPRFFKDISTESLTFLSNVFSKTPKAIQNNYKKVCGKTWDELTTTFLADEKNYNHIFDVKDPIKNYKWRLGQPRDAWETITISNPQHIILYNFYSTLKNWLESLWEENMPNHIAVLQKSLVELKTKLTELQASLRKLIPTTIPTKKPTPNISRTPAAIAEANHNLSVGIASRDIKQIDSALEAGANVNYEDTNGQTPLTNALKTQKIPPTQPQINQWFDVIELLCKQPDIEINKGNPLMLAVLQYMKFAKQLPNTKDVWLKIIQTLVRAGADSNNSDVKNNISIIKDVQLKTDVEKAIKGIK